MELSVRVSNIIKALNVNYPNPVCALTYEKPYELLVATRLSAQCTDERVNMITPVLFARFPTLESLAGADVLEVMDIVHSCGFFRTKAQNIVDMCQMLISHYDKKVPDTIEELIKLPGVGRKTANLIIGDVYGKPSVVADTHCIRISNLLGLCQSKDPVKVEMRLKEIIPESDQSRFCHQLVWHGRKICVARRPNCAICPLDLWCDFATGGAEKRPNNNAESKKRASPKRKKTADNAGK